MGERTEVHFCGTGEEYLCSYCMRNGPSAVAAENAAAAHLSYRPQNREKSRIFCYINFIL